MDNVGVSSVVLPVAVFEAIATSEQSEFVCNDMTSPDVVPATAIVGVVIGDVELAGLFSVRAVGVLGKIPTTAR